MHIQVYDKDTGEIIISLDISDTKTIGIVKNGVEVSVNECIQKCEKEKDINLNDYERIVLETDEDEPKTIADISKEEIDVENGYRVRLKPKH